MAFFILLFISNLLWSLNRLRVWSVFKYGPLCNDGSLNEAFEYFWLEWCHYLTGS